MKYVNPKYADGRFCRECFGPLAKAENPPTCVTGGKPWEPGEKSEKLPGSKRDEMGNKHVFTYYCDVCHTAYILARTLPYSAPQTVFPEDYWLDSEASKNTEDTQGLLRLIGYDPRKKSRSRRTQ